MDSMPQQEPPPPPVMEPGYTFGSVTDKISAIVLAKRTPRGWYLGFGAAFLLAMLLFVSLGRLVVKGIGIWGNNQPVDWAWDITNFVWWIGIGHAGTLISAILLLLRQSWRTSINRFAEAMTLFAVASAGIFPLFHTNDLARALLLPY
jgi:molybdopterin-containing oxidoreductase family membrane subunit